MRLIGGGGLEGECVNSLPRQSDRSVESSTGGKLVPKSNFCEDRYFLQDADSGI